MGQDKARSFVVIMIAVAIVSLALRILIDKIIKLSIAQNESRASLALKLISTALENYAKDNQGLYPNNLAALRNAQPAYLDQDYILSPTFKGYVYNCSRLQESGYSCAASPIKCNLTGNNVFIISTGGLLVQEGCIKKEAE
jgi:type II secretory pathway pseudopilin PulG